MVVVAFIKRDLIQPRSDCLIVALGQFREDLLFPAGDRKAAGSSSSVAYFFSEQSCLFFILCHGFTSGIGGNRHIDEYHE